MPSTHRRFRRKDLKQPDEFFSFVDRARTFLTDHLAEAIGIAAAVVVLAGAVIGIRVYRQHRAAAASSQFYNAFSALDAKDYKFAAQLFGKLADSAPGLRVGKLARFYLATCYLEQHQLPQARDAFKRYLADDPEPLFANLATMDLGIIYERMGDLKMAEATYVKAAAMPGPEQERAQLAAARIMVRQGKSQKAIAAYRSFLKQHPFAAERQEAMAALAQLGASPPMPAPIPAGAMPSGTPAAPSAPPASR